LCFLLTLLLTDGVCCNNKLLPIVTGMSFLLKILAALFYGCIWLLLRRLDCCDVHLVSTCRPVSHLSPFILFFMLFV